MKVTKRTILIGSFLLMFSLSSADDKSIEKNHFLGINPNIKNQSLRGELELLMQDFDIEKQKIQNYYKKEIEKLKEERSLEVKTIKKKFGEEREALLLKYGEERRLKHSKSRDSNISDKKIRKEKKPIRKSK